jgi:hypothetical protein
MASPPLHPRLLPAYRLPCSVRHSLAVRAEDERIFHDTIVWLLFFAIQDYYRLIAYLSRIRYSLAVRAEDGSTLRNTIVWLPRLPVHDHYHLIADSSRIRHPLAVRTYFETL